MKMNEIIAMTKGSERNKEAPAETNMWTTNAEEW